MKTDKSISRLTRLTKILFQLQSRRLVTSHELAQKFNISQRTVYRDIRALEEAGVPVIGEIGSGYFLPDDFRVPPLMFSQNEVNALLTAREFFSTNPDRSTQDDIDSLVVKVKAILRDSVRDKADLIEQRIKIYDSSRKDKTNHLSVIQTAITNCSVVSIQYHAIYSDKISYRDIEPLAVYFTKANWLMIAHCRLREELREFRIDRIVKLQCTNVTFSERPFVFEEYLAAIIHKNS